MTRINVVPVGCLSDKHLMAEYRELPRIFTAVKKISKHGEKPYDIDIPEKYKLGTGHVKFFYNKIGYLYSRYNEIYQELINRGFNLDYELYYTIKTDARQTIDDEWWGDYTPEYEDIYLNMARLAKRSKMENVLEELRSLS